MNASWKYTTLAGWCKDKLKEHHSIEAKVGTYRRVTIGNSGLKLDYGSSHWQCHQHLQSGENQLKTTPMTDLQQAGRNLCQLISREPAQT